MNPQTDYIQTKANSIELAEFAVARAIAKQLAATRRDRDAYSKQLPRFKEKAHQQHRDATLTMIRHLADTSPATCARVLFIADKADMPPIADILDDIGIRVSLNSRELVERRIKRLGCSMHNR